MASELGQHRRRGIVGLIGWVRGAAVRPSGVGQIAAMSPEAALEAALVAALAALVAQLRALAAELDDTETWTVLWA